MTVKILHLANDYSGSLVYRNLCQALDNLGVEQIVYVAIRSENLTDKNKVKFKKERSKIIYRNILNIYTRINYKAKIRIITNDLIKLVNIREFNVIHAHTWFSDGGVAYEFNKIYGIPYVVTIRGTDYNVFYKYMFFLREYGLKILRNSSRIIFISPSYQRKVCTSSFILKHLPDLKVKSELIPNGINTFWLNNIRDRKHVNEILNLLYVGRFTKGKNTENLIKSVEVLIKRGIKCQLNLIGGGGSEHSRIMKRIDGKSYIRYYGKITDKEELKRHFSGNDIFVMPSRFETFGLVYIEALSQGIPVIYTKNQAIDGLYGKNIGEAVEWNNIEDIANGIVKIFNNFNKYDFNPGEITKNHQWGNIAKRYFNIYDL